MNYGRDSVADKIEHKNNLARKLSSRAVMDGVKITVLLVLLAVILAAAFIYGTIRGIVDTAPSADTLTVTPLGIASGIYDSAGQLQETLVTSGSNRDPVSYDQIPKNLIDAFVAIEDERFWTHEGVDIRGILRSASALLLQGGIKGGASTITQQLIKNNIFEGGMERGWGARFIRKFQEQYLAIVLENSVSKEDILINYMNTINLGANCLGVQVAAHRYFMKDVSELTLSECACIAGITQNPYYYNPIRFPAHNQDKREIVLNYMEEQGRISYEEKMEAFADTADLYERIQNNNLVIKENVYPYTYFTDAVIENVLVDLQSIGYNEADAYTLLYSGGLNIYTTQNSTYQKILDNEVNNPDNYPDNAFKWSFNYKLNARLSDGTTVTYTEYTIRRHFNLSNLVYNTKEEIQELIRNFKFDVMQEGDVIADEQVYYILQPQLSAAIIDQNTGYVVALTGGRGEKELSRSLNRATDTYRSPGSTFKVLGSFAPAIDSGKATLATVMEDVPYTYKNNSIKNWWDKNLNLGWCNARSGMVYSMNVLTVRFMDLVGAETAFDYLEKFGFSSLVRSEVINGKTYSDIGPTLCLGGITNGVCLTELTGAYATLASGGQYREPILYTHITDHYGNVIFEKVPKSERVLSESTAFLLTNAISDTMREGNIKNSGLNPTAQQAFLSNMAAAGKSGTSTDNQGKSRDIWFVGYTPYYTMGIWSGFDDGSVPLEGNVDLNGYHFAIWHNVMSQIHSSYSYKAFEAPDDVSFVRVCALSGKLALNGVCDHDPQGCGTYYEYFAAGTEPKEYCDVHTKVKYCSDSHCIAGEFCTSTEEKIVYRLTKGPDTTLDTPYIWDPSSKICEMHTSPNESQAETQDPSKPPAAG